MDQPFAKRFSQLADFAKQHPLGYRMMLYVTACSFVFILVSTALQLTFDYRRELKGIQQQTELIQSSYLATLAKSLWDLDRAQVALQLKGIQSLPDVMHLKLSYNNAQGAVQIPTGEAPAAGHRVQRQGFQLIHTTDATPRSPLGSWR